MPCRNPSLLFIFLSHIIASFSSLLRIENQKKTLVWELFSRLPPPAQIVRNMEEYESLAIALANNPTKLVTLKRKLRNARYLSWIMLGWKGLLWKHEEERVDTNNKRKKGYMLCWWIRLCVQKEGAKKHHFFLSRIWVLSDLHSIQNDCCCIWYCRICKGILHRSAGDDSPSFFSIKIFCPPLAFLLFRVIAIVFFKKTKFAPLSSSDALGCMGEHRWRHFACCGRKGTVTPWYWQKVNEKERRNNDSPDKSAGGMFHCGDLSVSV